MHVYSLQEYVEIGKQEHITYLERLFYNNELLARTLVPNFLDLRRAINDPQGFGQILLAEREKSINELKQNMQNIADAIDVLKEMQQIEKQEKQK